MGIGTGVRVRVGRCERGYNGELYLSRKEACPEAGAVGEAAEAEKFNHLRDTASFRSSTKDNTWQWHRLNFAKFGLSKIKDIEKNWLNY